MLGSLRSLSNFGLAFQKVFIFDGRNPRVNGSFRVGVGREGFNAWLSYDDGADISLKAGDLSGLEPAPSLWT
jgi:hypothetical protein